MELKCVHQSDLTETSKRALATNRGQSETLKSTYETLQSDYKAKRHTLNAEQARFMCLIKAKLPAIKISNDENESTRACCTPFSTLANSPNVERKTTYLPALAEPSHHARRRCKSFSDVSEAVRAQQHQVQGSMKRQKSSEQLQSRSERENQQRNFIKTRPRSQSNAEHLWLSAKFDVEERLPENVNNKQLLTETIGSHRKASSPAKIPLVYVYTLQTSKNPLEQQLEDVKNLR